MKNKIIFALSFIAVLLSQSYANAAKLAIKGDPEVAWLSPLGNEDIENNAYNRCMFIQTLKPGEGNASVSANNAYDTLSNYATNLYAQSLKISAHIENEKKASANITPPDLSNAKAITESEITSRLVGISRRLNIINSFEASSEMLSNVKSIIRLPSSTYQSFRAMVDGKYTYTSDCEALKDKNGRKQ